jgi:N-acetylglucosaminyldiphosphoundecaprenol N-acetyl-beta-D-mannosaminyltransferase
MVCFSFPRQELWIHQNIKNSGAKVGIGLGGTFDYVSGKKPRAPRIFRTFGLEWFYRFITQPSRYKRMLAIPYLTYLALRYRERLSK